MIVWLRRSLTIFQYVGLHIVAGLLISLIFLWIFGRLADQAFEESWVITLDNIVANTFHNGATPTATFFFYAVTQFGGPIIWVVGLGAGYIFFRNGWHFRLVLWVIALLGGQVLNSALKEWFARPRPVFDEPIASAAFYSFPSGHAMMSLITYGLLAYFLVVSTRYLSRRLLITTIALLIIFLVGLSRIYLGVHYLSDIGAGFAAGAVWLSTCITAFNFLYDRQTRKRAQLENQNTDNPNN